ncbi:CPBP family glutamic-type intramembrane protease [Leptolyngbya iicbica]|uniref:CPBP family intramembrane metalloprotease n=2 Tax=Cyanophyceae TaxID=3028117 RepID=A0A4V2E3A1_9CYAN|nr:CPBP family glutamic-type intramembrane protease [Leptolyngbya sp. LK]RZM81720.1 CPBP family intramembrane metalloprotease [Leptolyngbya sp. LK]
MEELPRVVVSIVGFCVGWLGVWSLLAIPLSQKIGWRPFQPTPPEQKLALLLPLYALAPVAIAIANRRLHQTWADQGLVRGWHSVWAFGLGWGVAISGLGLVLWVKRLSGLNTLPVADDNTRQSETLRERWLPTVGLLALGLVIGGSEELIFRGWLQTQLALVLSPWGAAAIASALFAVAHLIWDGREGLWQQPGLWLLGLVLVVACWADDGSIAIAWGLHAGWVTGLAYIGEFVRPSPVEEKPTWLTGRAAQPLTDIWDGSLLILTAVVVWLLADLLPPG